MFYTIDVGSGNKSSFLLNITCNSFFFSFLRKVVYNQFDSLHYYTSVKCISSYQLLNFIKLWVHEKYLLQHQFFSAQY